MVRRLSSALLFLVVFIVLLPVTASGFLAGMVWVALRAGNRMAQSFTDWLAD